MTTNYIDIHAYKGGVGTTTVACALAVACSKRGKTILIDASGTPTAYGWFGAMERPEGQLTTMDENLSFIHTTTGQSGHAISALDISDVEFVVIDNGRNTTDPVTKNAKSGTRICVVRNDYMTLRNTVGKFQPDTEELLLFETEGVLNAQDIRLVLGKAPVVMPYDEAIQRAIDAGLAYERDRLFTKWTSELLKEVTADKKKEKA